jgi:hypothetical protein
MVKYTALLAFFSAQQEPKNYLANENHHRGCANEGKK